MISQASVYLWSYLINIEGWRIRTDIDMGGSADLRYYQAIVHPNETSSLKDAICLHSWLGFRLTEWSLLGQSDEAGAADSVEELCRHFLSAVPSLLRGIDA